MSSNKQFIAPFRAISTQKDVEIFTSSETCALIELFVLTLNSSVRDIPTDYGKESNNANQTLYVSKPVSYIVDNILDNILKLVEKNPAIPNNKSRFGNPAFKDFYSDLETKMKEYHLGLVKSACTDLVNDSLQKNDKDFNNDNNKFNDAYDISQAYIELSPYLAQSFGNPTRLDYGSGHELNFICWLVCLDQLNIINVIPKDVQLKYKKPLLSTSKEILEIFKFEDDSRAVVIRIFEKYIKVMRVIQSTYWLEPAGSHGVWGLDDYHFLPFLFGSSQLVGHKYLKPKSIHDKDVLEMYSSKSMYLAAVSFINATKTTATLRWHSPMLDDISGVKTWGKVNQGMIKMYKVEVLGKLPVLQHFMFGSILQLPDGIELHNNEDNLSDSKKHSEHVHLHSWGDCCGNKIPSSIAALQSDNSKHLRQIPFD